MKNSSSLRTSRDRPRERRLEFPLSEPQNYLVVISTHDPDYLPATSAELRKLTKIVLELKQAVEHTPYQSEEAIPQPAGSLLHPSARQRAESARQAPVRRARRETLQEKFRSLAEGWRRDTLFSSSITEIAMHPGYQQIIGMGPDALQMILRELSREPDHWFWALTAITGQDPVPDSAKGDLDEMTEAWLRWARQRGYI